METLLFAVYDSAASRYLDPFVAPTAEVAIRGFKTAVNRPEHAFNSHPADYTLFQVGRFDPETGILVPANPHNLGNGVQLLDAPTPMLSPLTEAINDG